MQKQKSENVMYIYMCMCGGKKYEIGDGVRIQSVSRAVLLYIRRDEILYRAFCLFCEIFGCVISWRISDSLLCYIGNDINICVGDTWI